MKQQTESTIVLENDSCRLNILTYGATLQEFSIQDEGWENIILSYDTVEEYMKDTYYLGATIGRVAGRIDNSTFDLDGTTYRLPANDGMHHLHGGDGLHRRVWAVEQVTSDRVLLHYVSPDGANGYVGTLDVRAMFELIDQGVIITYEATCDKDTICDLTNHTYFNLSGGERDILNHELTLSADTFAELRDDLIPTGRLLEVDGIPFDFRTGRALSDGVVSTHPQNELVNGYDHPFIFTDRREARLYDRESQRELTLSTTAPAIVLYSGNQMNETTSLREGMSRRYYGVCLEPQHLPDAVHHETFPSIRLKAGDTYRWQTTYRVETGVSR
ncbi:aldose epimerase family protein [Exiguobacterium sp. SH0S2]|uniref:aldose epimerase family protein n=1 Tax=Exiguobacterium sp. SH0S2 TaxID=2510950 RepID=UPI00103F916D|nr:aldose epimerase family protein [Exiguobacterium sp. SH0S2]TCI63213.1 galactose mutarotase [Exiguobacterium sp. SH0S2]